MNAFISTNGLKSITDVLLWHLITCGGWYAIKQRKKIQFKLIAKIYLEGNRDQGNKQTTKIYKILVLSIPSYWIEICAIYVSLFVI